MKKRMYSLLLAVVMLFSLMPCAMAEEPQISSGTVPSSEYQVARGLWSSTVVWLLTSGDSGLTAPYTLYFAPLAGEDGNPVDGSDTLNASTSGAISSVGGDDWNAAWCAGVEKIIVAGGITRINGILTASSSTYNWNNVKEIYLPEGLQYLDYRAFYGCGSLKTVHLPYMPENAPDAAFRPYTALYWTESYDVAQKDGQNGKFMSVDGVLYSGDGRTLLRYPARRNPGTSYTVPESVVDGVNVEKIGNYAFALGDQTNELQTKVTRFTKLVIPATVREVGYSMLYGDNRISEITFLNCEDPADVAGADLTLDGNAFSLGSNQYVTLTLPSHMKKLPKYISIKGNSSYGYRINFSMPAAQVQSLENFASFM